MKEQVSVDYAIGESETVESVYLPIAEYERLKRIDDKINKEIKSLKELIKLYDSYPDRVQKVQKKLYELNLELLESLDK